MSKSYSPTHLRRNVPYGVRAEYLPSRYVFDLQAALPNNSLPPDQRHKYWDDLIHLTAEGYDLMGEKFGAKLLGLLESASMANRISLQVSETKNRRCSS